MTFLGKEFYVKSRNRGYRDLARLTRHSTYPPSLGSDSVLLNNLMFKSICEDFYQPLKGKGCEMELVNTGFDTIAVYVFESTKKVLIKFEDEEESSEAAKEIMNSNNFKKLGKKLGSKVKFQKSEF